MLFLNAQSQVARSPGLAKWSVLRTLSSMLINERVNRKWMENKTDWNHVNFGHKIVISQVSELGQNIQSFPTPGFE